MPMLEVTNLEASYGAVQALRGVSLHVDQGNIVALLGANGAGKTSVLKTISGIVEPRRGSVRFDGRDLSGMEPDRIVGIGLGHVPEGREIFKMRTVQENLVLGAYLRHDRAGIQADMERIFGNFPILHERRLQRAGLLSGGQQQMLAIGRALMGKPRVMLMDEPSLGLSPLLVKEIFTIVRRLRDEGMTILLVEQNASVALDVADYGYVMEVGRVVMEGTAQSLRDNPTIREFYLGVAQDGATTTGGGRRNRKKQW